MEFHIANWGSHDTQRIPGQGGEKYDSSTAVELCNLHLTPLSAPPPKQVMEGELGSRTTGSP